MKTPLTNAIIAHKNHISFHTPAHGGGFNMDITELSYSDNLLNPCGVIFESEREISKVYGVDNTYYVTTGATTAIAVAVRALRDKKFLVLPNAHKSVFNALRVNGIKRAYYLDNLDTLEETVNEIRPEVIFCTSPNYYGITVDLERIRSVASSVSALLIIDAAHGSHFVFSSLLPDSATKYGDIVIHSCHKTLNTLTGSALIHFTEGLSERIKTAFSELHTTSPSYLIMTETEKAIAELEANGENAYSAVKKAIEDFDVLPPLTVRRTDDFTRLVVACGGYDSDYISDRLEEEEIFAEMSDGNNLVFIVTPQNARHLPSLKKALDNIVKKGMPLAKPYSVTAKRNYIELRFGSEYEFVLLDDAVGRTAYREVGIYPPGVPLVFSGELFTIASVDYIKKNINKTFGLEKERVAVVK